MAIKKSELYSKLWQSCDKLRGGMEASQYKDYILTFLFLKYVSDKYANEKIPEFIIPQGCTFEDISALKNMPSIKDEEGKINSSIGDKLNKILGKIAEANQLNGIIDQVDFNDETKLGNDKDKLGKLTKLIAIFEDLNFYNNKANDDDILGDAYEYLISHFAKESGKDKGEFYTPSEVSRLISQIIGIDLQSVQGNTTFYDPTCGSGSLLLKLIEYAGKGTIYGQEKYSVTAGLCILNMILHGNSTAEIKSGNTLSEPKHLKNGALQTFDYVVANPPFSDKDWTTGIQPNQDIYDRFKLGIPPEKNGDYAFLLHIIASLKPHGKGACILPHGVLFRGNTEGEIRKNIIQKGYIKGIIGLPANLFYGTGIPACIIILDKENAQNRTHIFMLDASKSFVKDGNKNRLREQDIHKIADAFNKQINIEKYSRLVPISEIQSEKNNYNLNIPRYIDTKNDEDIQDIYAHLHGGIPNIDIEKLKDYWQEMPTLKRFCFHRIQKIIKKITVLLI